MRVFIYFGSIIVGNFKKNNAEITCNSLKFRFLTPPVNPQVPSPSSGRAEDPGCNKKERQRQPPQRHPHEGVLLLPQSPLHLL